MAFLQGIKIVHKAGEAPETDNHINTYREKERLSMDGEEKSTR